MENICRQAIVNSFRASPQAVAPAVLQEVANPVATPYHNYILEYVQYVMPDILISARVVTART
jgi:hypothetical protein